MSHEADNLLIEQFKTSGDLEVLGKLYSKYMHHVFNVAYKYFGEREESQDAVMGVFELLIKDLPKYEIRKFGPWLLMVTRNYCLKRLRKEKQIRGKQDGYKAYLEDFVETDYQMDPSIENDKEMAIRNLETAMEDLKDEQRTCVVMFYLEKLCYQEVADRTGFSIKQVKSYIQNGKRNLKIRLDDMK